MAWTLHLRDEKGNRHPLQLPRGGESTVRELKQMVCKVPLRCWRVLPSLIEHSCTPVRA